MPSKILHNLRSVTIANLLSRFSNPRFNHSFFTFWSFSGAFDTAAIRKTFFTPECLNFFDKPTLLADTRISISKSDMDILRKPPPASIPTLTSRDLLILGDLFCKIRTTNLQRSVQTTVDCSECSLSFVSLSTLWLFICNSLKYLSTVWLFSVLLSLDPCSLPFLNQLQL